jgi:predicted dehydrogenase
MKFSKNNVIRLGIIGTGRIANRFVREVQFVNGVYITSVYNPRPSKAKQFAVSHQIQFVYTSLEEMFNHVDAVYIASPHGTHYEYIRETLLHDKHVLCEKPMVLKKSHAIELYTLAQEKNLVLMEGIKTAYCPGFIDVIDISRSGRIGEIRDVEATFTKLTDSSLRELTDVSTGGSYLELASYTLLAIIKLLGSQYKELRFDSFLAENGLDLYTKTQLAYGNSLATSKTGLGVKSEGQLIISGTRGYIRVDAPWWKTQSFEICFEDTSLNEKISVEYLGDGLRYEVNSFVSTIQDNEQSRKLTPEESIVLAELMEKFIEKSGRKE